MPISVPWRLVVSFYFQLLSDRGEDWQDHAYGSAFTLFAVNMDTAAVRLNDLSALK
jgi:hypothetical protein